LLGARSPQLLAQPTTSTPVTTIISDYDSGIAPALQIQSDQLGAYKNAKNLQSYVYSFGSWEIDAYNVRNATRTVYLGFTQPIAGTGPDGGPPVAPPSGFYKAHLTTECYHYGTNPTTMAPGSTISCPMNGGFEYGGKAYTIRMNPLDAMSIGTDPVKITCIFPSMGTNPCSQWRITPGSSVANPDGTVIYRSVGQLDVRVTSRGQTTFIRQGQFYFSFLILVTNP
jgi:hypothetical protein